MSPCCFLVIYRLKIFSEESVPLFGPPLPSPPVFTDHQEFRDFLLVKCEEKDDQSCDGIVSRVLEGLSFFWYFAVINGEKATLETPTFAQKRQRTLDMLIRSLYQDLMPDLHKVGQLFSDRCRRLLPSARGRTGFLWKFRCLSPHWLKPQPHCCTAFFPLQPPVCFSILHHDWILLQCWLSQTPPPLASLLFFFFLNSCPCDLTSTSAPNRMSFWLL